MISGTIYHVYNRANGNDDLFLEEKNYHFFMEKYFKYIYPIAETYAYCLMPNHFHFMLKIRDEEAIYKNFNSFADTTGFGNLISQQFSNLFNSYTKAFNKAYERNGSLFQRPFKKKAVTNDAYFTQLLLYIHLNPVKHGFVKNYFEWAYSSYQLYIPPFLPCFESIEKLLLKDEVLKWFGNDINHFLQVHEAARSKQLISVFD